MGSLVVFTDGACSANGKTNAKGGYSTVWPDYPEMDGGWPLEGEKATNNRAEMMGLIKSFEIADMIDPERKMRLEVYTDSMFMINCVTKWLANWKKNGFKKSDGTSVLNQDLLQQIDALRLKRVLVLNHVRAHTKNTDWKSLNNAKADALARDACAFVF
jgi:ribonuclease HI